jgi:hypothetical protein
MALELSLRFILLPKREIFERIPIMCALQVLYIGVPDNRYPGYFPGMLYVDGRERVFAPCLVEPKSPIAEFALE